MTNNINDILASIGEAKRALEAEPQYQSHIRELERQLSVDGQTIALREQRIHELKRNEEELTAKLRSVEVERDDAAFRSLESEDRVSSLTRHLQQVVGDSLKMLELVGGEPQRLVKQSEITATANAIQDLEAAHAGARHHVSTLEAEVAQAATERDAALRDLEACKAALQGMTAPAPDPLPTSRTESLTPSSSNAGGEPYQSPAWTEASNASLKDERAPDPTAPSGSYSIGGFTGSDPLSSTSLTPPEVGAADPFAPKDNTASAPASSPGASESGNAFWHDSSNH